MKGGPTPFEVVVDAGLCLAWPALVLALVAEQTLVMAVRLRERILPPS